MKILTIVSLPLKDVIRDFAREFHTTYSENCSEYSVDIPSDWGSGFIKGINFKQGLGIIQYHCTFNFDLTIKFTVNEVHPLKFLYSVQGNFDHAFEEEEAYHPIEKFQGCIVASQNHLGHMLRFKKGETTEICSLEIVRSEFKQQMSCEFQDIDPSLDEVFRDRKAEKSFYYRGYFSLQIYMLFQKIKDFEHNNLIKKLFLEGKAYDILSQQIIEYHDDVNNDESHVLRNVDAGTIETIAQHIKKNINQQLEVKQLISTFNISEAKLQNGFKLMFGKTVNEYAQTERLHAAIVLLTSTDLSISEIVYSVGLSSKSYFSKVFKEKYGLTPSSYKKGLKI